MKRDIILFILLSISLICLTIILFYVIKNESERKSNPSTTTTMETFEKKFLEDERSKKNRHPFRFLKDEKGNVLPIVALTAFFRNDGDKNRYNNFIKKNIKVIGVTAYRDFPNIIQDSTEDNYQRIDNFNYTQNIKPWLYCMRNYSNYGLSPLKNKLLEMSESDFYTAETTIHSQKKYDFIYVCLKDDDKCSLNGWQSSCRNFSLALKCFPILCNQLKLKGLLVGRVGCGLEEQYKGLIETTDFLQYHDLQNKMKESRFLFVPNISDASPRVVAECLIKNVPILMNANILCGFKYINNETGEFFSSESDVGDATRRLLTKLPNISPQKWWAENYSYSKSAIKLRDFLYESYPDVLKNVKEVSFFL
jgi:hypothetical protein